MRVRLSILPASLLLAGLAGCKGKAELRTKLDMRYGTIRLMPGAIAEVGEIMERGYQEYLEFKKVLDEG